jgi:PHS family inorganic phosphate transporter-like MFS transporter
MQQQPPSPEESTYQSFEDMQRPLLDLQPETSMRINDIFDDDVDEDDDDDDDRNVGHHAAHSSQQENNSSPSPLSSTATPNNNNNNNNDNHWYQNSLQITAMISNFSTSYNVVNISLVIPILKEIYPGSSDKDTAAVASSLLAGMIAGQLIGGALGDSRLGRLGALRLVMTLQIVASMICALSSPNHAAEDIFLWLALWRFLLGIGCGGVYPLAAVLSAEEGRGDDDGEENNRQIEPMSVSVHTESDLSDENNNNPGEINNTRKMSDSSSVHRVVLTFSMQGLGFISVPLVAVFLLYCTTNLNIVWRTILGLGALPGFILMAMQCWQIMTTVNDRYRYSRDPFFQEEEQSEEGSDGELENDSILESTTHTNLDESERIAILVDTIEDAQIDNEITYDDIGSSGDNGGWVQTLLNEPGLGRKVLGTAGTWFLFDIVFYGNTIFQPIVVEAAFGNKDGSTGIELLRKTAMDSLILTSIALPGYAFAGIMMGRKTFCVTQTPRYVMLQGFAAMSILYATIGINWNYLRGDPIMLVFLYGMTFFFSNYGPNTVTFIMPSLIFEEEHRATWNGVSAAAGKLGALTGATLFEPTADLLGDHAVMLICAGVALFAYLLTYCTVPKQEKEQERSSMTTDTADNAFDSEVV